MHNTYIYRTVWPGSKLQPLPESRELHLGGRHLGRPVGRVSRCQRLLLL